MKIKITNNKKIKDKKKINYGVATVNALKKHTLGYVPHEFGRASLLALKTSK